MRKIDRWAGIPITMVISVLLWLKKTLLFQRRKLPDPSRTLFIELSEMGSAIIVDPAMRKLIKEVEADVYFAIFRSNYKSLNFLNTVVQKNIFTMRSDSLIHMAIDIFKFTVWCRKNRITTVIDLELFSRFTAILCAFSGATARVGFTNLHDEGLYRGTIINYPVRYNPHVHMSVNFMSLVQTTLGLNDTPYPTTPVDPADLKLAKAEITKKETDVVKSKIRILYPPWRDEKLILINANASDLLPQRRWLPEYFAWVSRKILEFYPNVLLIATGSPEEREFVQNVVDLAENKRFVNSAGVFEFEELVPLYSISQLMLTNDSGPAHFAAVTDLKVFVLFGPETPTLYLPMGNAEAIYLGLPCSPCVSAANHRKTTCETRPCMTGIQPEMVFERIDKFLSGS